MNEITFHPVNRGDYNDILELEESVFIVDDQLNRDDLEEFYSDPGCGFYKLIMNESLIGYIIFFVEKNSGYIESIAIEKRYRNQGYGRFALRFIIRNFIEKKINKIALHVRTDNTAAVKLYEEEGFVRDCIVDHFYKDGRPAYLYTKSLKT